MALIKRNVGFTNISLPDNALEKAFAIVVHDSVELVGIGNDKIFKYSLGSTQSFDDYKWFTETNGFNVNSREFRIDNFIIQEAVRFFLQSYDSSGETLTNLLHHYYKVDLVTRIDVKDFRFRNTALDNVVSGTWNNFIDTGELIIESYSLVSKADARQLIINFVQTNRNFLEGKVVEFATDNNIVARINAVNTDVGSFVNNRLNNISSLNINQLIEFADYMRTINSVVP